MADLQRARAHGWIDVHAHFSVPRPMEELQAGLKLMHAGCFMLPQPYVWSLEGTLDHMDRCGIAMQLLSNIPRAVPALQESNDYGAELVGCYPTRFGLLAAIPTRDPDAALAERASDRTRCKPTASRSPAATTTSTLATRA